MFNAVGRTFFRLDDPQLTAARALELLRARAALAVYAASLLGTALSVRREAESAFLLVAISVASALWWLVLLARGVRGVDESLLTLQPLARFLLLLVRTLFPPPPGDARSAALYVLFALSATVYLGLQVALALGV
ncbi:MAG: hypothetical protein ACE5GC_01930 [Acidimicrobiia bacterium]